MARRAHDARYKRRLRTSACYFVFATPYVFGHTLEDKKQWLKSRRLI